MFFRIYLYIMDVEIIIIYYGMTYRNLTVKILNLCVVSLYEGDSLSMKVVSVNCLSTFAEFVDWTSSLVRICILVEFDTSFVQKSCSKFSAPWVGMSIWSCEIVEHKMFGESIWLVQIFPDCSLAPDWQGVRLPLEIVSKTERSLLDDM